MLRTPVDQLGGLIRQPLSTFTPADDASALYSLPIKRSSKKLKTSASVAAQPAHPPPSSLVPDSPPPYPDNEWDNHEFDGSSEYPQEGQDGTANAALQFHESDTSTEHECKHMSEGGCEG